MELKHFLLLLCCSVIFIGVITTFSEIIKLIFKKLSSERKNKKQIDWLFTGPIIMSIISFFINCAIIADKIF